MPALFYAAYLELIVYDPPEVGEFHSSAGARLICKCT